MSINLTDELIAKTKKGKLASAKQVYLDGDQENLQQVGEKTHQLEQSIKDIAASGGASVASAVTYDNATSGMTSVTAQGAIDELAAKNAAQDTEIAKKANSSDVDSQMQTEQDRVNAELDKKFDKDNVVQELGDAEDKVVSQYALPFRIEESPEWAYLIKDAEDHVLFGIQQDGSVEWQVGIPAPIRKRFEEILSSASNDKSELSTKIDELNTSLSAEIQSLQDTKVDKEEGKSLIDDEVKQHFEVIENDEWFTLMTDAEDHILFGIKRDTGKPYFPLNEMYHVEQSPEFFALWKDAEDHILMGIRRDGEIVGEIHAVNVLKQTITDIQSDVETLKSNVSTIDASLQELLNVFSLQENPEFLAVETDAEGKMLAYTKNDGSHYVYNMKSETIPEEFSHIEDPEGRMAIETDAEQKILAYRDKEGVKHEHEAEVNTLHVSNLDLKDSSVNDIRSALIANGFTVKQLFDWSEWVKEKGSALELPIPRRAIVNITGVDKMPSKKLVDDEAYLEYYDFSGNYFKLKAYLNAQGASTMADPMKSCAIALFSDDWGGNSFEIKFGSWVSQDSFHLKALWKDALKTIQPVCYELGNQITTFLNVRSNRFVTQSDNVLMGGTGDTGKDFSQALCMPSQFPVELYLNGEYYGLFLWSLKKHRKNYSMDKKDYESILIDNVGGMFNYDTFAWTTTEIRNPKKLICVDGEVYDSDYHRGELIGSDTVAGKSYTFSKLNAATTDIDTFEVTSVAYDSSNKDMVNTAKTKSIIEYSKAGLAEVKNASDTSSKKLAAEKYFDIQNILAYIIFCELTYNEDGWYNNAQITIFNKKVGYNIYDCDSCLGKSWNGILWTSSLSREVIADNNPTGVIKRLYTTELAAMYKKLRDAGIVSIENCNKILDEWYSRIGSEAFSRSIKKWATSPSYSKPNNLDSHWEPYIPTSSEEASLISKYNDETEYNVGDKVCYGNGGYNNYYYVCLQQTTGNSPTTDGNYYTNAMYDTPERIKAWMRKRIEFCDNLWNYK